jgi:hypothetical protein
LPGTLEALGIDFEHFVEPLRTIAEWLETVVGRSVAARAELRELRAAGEVLTAALREWSICCPSVVHLLFIRSRRGRHPELQHTHDRAVSLRLR